jgi:hypothetical protein
MRSKIGEILAPPSLVRNFCDFLHVRQRNLMFSGCSLWNISFCWQIGYDGVRLTSQNCRLYGPIFRPRTIAMWIIARFYRLRLTPNSPTRVLWQPQVLSSQHRYLWSEQENGWRKWEVSLSVYQTKDWEFCLSVSKIPQGIFKMP